MEPTERRAHDPDIIEAEVDSDAGRGTGAAAVEQAILDYLHEKRGTLDSKKESTKHTIRKIAGVLKPLTSFLKNRGIVYLRDVKTEHLTAFQETWQGRSHRDRVTSAIEFQPKSLIGKQKNQELLKMFFMRARQLRWIHQDDAQQGRVSRDGALRGDDELGVAIGVARFELGGDTACHLA